MLRNKLLLYNSAAPLFFTQMVMAQNILKNEHASHIINYCIIVLVDKEQRENTLHLSDFKINALERTYFFHGIHLQCDGATSSIGWNGNT